ncbi:hypothetical protein LSAT2_005367 [Lamellibrachia satsuma]|nr:hypothetical protein LSAT2_005367 [Lamellibrachia satsuma]
MACSILIAVELGVERYATWKESRDSFVQNRCRFVRSYGGDVIVEPASCRATAARTAPAAERAFGSPVNPEEVGPLPSTTTTRQAGEVEEGDGVGVGEGGIVECFCAARLCLSPDESGRHALDCPCFMFRFRRTNLVKRLWKARVTNQHEGQCADEACDAAAAAADELELKSVAHSLLKRLKEKQLGVLIQSLESRGGDTTECLLLSRGDLRLGRRSVAPHVLCCQIWRWPNLQADYLLKRMPCCNSAGDPTSVCCNPYHWSRLNLPDSPPPPYSKRVIKERVFIKQDGPQTTEEVVSTETGGTQLLTPFTPGQCRSRLPAGISSAASQTQANNPWWRWRLQCLPAVLIRDTLVCSESSTRPCQPTIGPDTRPDYVTGVNIALTRTESCN